MMSLTALMLRNIDPATDQGVPKLQSTKVEAMAEIEVRRAKAEADDDATRCHDERFLRRSYSRTHSIGATEGKRFNHLVPRFLLPLMTALNQYPLQIPFTYQVFAGRLDMIGWINQKSGLNA
ncbi:Cadherin-related tumor suppressor [Gossypium arboreum]|uniref:Cadherin-related tumor suppressor n=1 Tax=Gossypium arboreum TaxID=29729 RepID=A0A0B0NK07_GOSAR|nr:Cadherin-related tumor suppressor [Gossypium arboreum]